MSDDAQRDAWDSIGTPNCPRCLVMCEQVGETGAWGCPECGLVIL